MRNATQTRSGGVSTVRSLSTRPHPFPTAIRVARAYAAAVPLQFSPALAVRTPACQAAQTRGLCRSPPLLSILADPLQLAVIGPPQRGPRPPNAAAPAAAHGRIGPASQARRQRQESPDAAQCSTPICTSTPGSPAPAAQTPTSTTSPGGHCARGSPSWERVISRTQGGPGNSGGR